MKIAIVCQPWDEVVPSYQSGSIPIIAYQLAQRLVRNNEVVIYAKKGQGQAARQVDDDGIKYRRYPTALEDWLLRPLKVLERLLQYPSRFKPLYSRRIFYRLFASQIATDVRSGDFDIVHVINFSQFVPLIKARSPNVKTVLHMECEWLTQLDRSQIEKRLRSVDLVVGCSRFVTEETRQRFPAIAVDCLTIFNGVDADQYSASRNARLEARNRAKIGENEERLLFVGRVSPEKGIHVLLDAFAKVAAKSPTVQLDIVGPAGSAPYEYTILVSDDAMTSDLASFYSSSLRTRHGKYFAYLKSKIPTELRERVSFHGVIPQTDIVDYYRAADLFIFPSVWHEPFGMPLIEAMACELPVIATRSGGMPEIVQDGVTGTLIERGDSTGLAEAIADLLDDDEKRRSMGKRGRERVQEVFSWGHVAADLEKCYRELLSSNVDVQSPAPKGSVEHDITRTSNRMRQ